MVYCAACNLAATKNRSWTEWMRRRRALNPRKQKAREMLQDRVRRGKILRQPCQFCANPKSEAHHLVYDFPFVIVWACINHHRQIHREAQAMATVITPITPPKHRKAKTKK
jgi:hypothetical protein